MNYRLKRKVGPDLSNKHCRCGNGPLTESDMEFGEKCLCCRSAHVFYHDDLYCRRCSCPHKLAGCYMEQDAI